MLLGRIETANLPELIAMGWSSNLHHIFHMPLLVELGMVLSESLDYGLAGLYDTFNGTETRRYGVGSNSRGN